MNGTRSIPATGQMSAELTFTMPLTPGEYELRFFGNSNNLLATSPVVTVRPPSLTVSATTVAPGGSVQVSVAEGPGQRGDWVALAAVGSGLASHVDWNYLSGARSMPATGVSSAVLTFDMPETGAYEFRFFANNVYTLLATSPVVTVELPSIPVLEVVPASLSFGTVETDASADQLVTVRNAGAGTLVGEATAVGAGFSLVGNTSYALGADETALLTVRFAPVSAGAASGALSLTGAEGATVPLSGIGELPSTTPLLEVDPQTLSFGSVAPGGSADLSITVRNAGAGILAGEATVTGPGFLLVGVHKLLAGSGRNDEPDGALRTARRRRGDRNAELDRWRRSHGASERNGDGGTDGDGERHVGSPRRVGGSNGVEWSGEPQRLGFAGRGGKCCE